MKNQMNQEEVEKFSMNIWKFLTFLLIISLCKPPALLLWINTIVIGFYALYFFWLSSKRDYNENKRMIIGFLLLYPGFCFIFFKITQKGLSLGEILVRIINH